MIYEIGDLALISVAFTNAAGAPADPTTVTLLVEAPDGTQATYVSPQVVHDSTGNFHYNLSITESGIYKYRWTGTGAVTVVIENTLTVAATLLQPPPAPLLCSLDQVKAYLYPVQGATTDDVLLQSLIASASKFLIDETRRGADLYSSANYSDRYDGNNQDFLRLRHNPVTAVSLVQFCATVIPQSPDYIQPGWQINQDNGDGTGTGLVMIPGRWNYPFASYNIFPRGRLNILVNYTAGYSAVPADLQEATWELIAQNYKRRGWIDEVSRALPMGGGTTTYQKWDVPPKVRRVINYYRRVTP